MNLNHHHQGGRGGTAAKSKAKEKEGWLGEYLIR